MTTLTQILETQANKATTANDCFDAVSIAGLFGVKQELTVGLTFAFFGGILYVNGAASSIADGTVALTASTTNYIEATAAGVVSKNTTAFSAGSTPLYTAVTSASGITTLTDYRQLQRRSLGRLSIDIAGSGATYTLNVNQALADELIFTGVRTANGDVVLPTVARSWIIHNNTSGAYVQTFKTAAGTGVPVPVGYRQVVYCDGTNIVTPTGFANLLLAVSSTVLQVGVRGSAPALTLEAMDGTNEGGQLDFKGAASFANWSVDLFQNTLRFTSSGSSSYQFQHTASSVNGLVFTPGTTGNNAAIASVGEAAVGLSISGGGTGNINFFSSTYTEPMLQLARVASANRYLIISPSNGGNPTLSASGGSPAVAGALIVSSTLYGANSVATPAGGSTTAGMVLGSAGIGFYIGSGAPTLSAAKGSYYARSDGSGTTNRGYINTDGATTWTAITTVA